MDRRLSEIKVPCRAISNSCSLCDVGLIEFEDTHSDEIKMLVWGKATRYYLLNEDEYRANNVIQYLADIPMAQQRTGQTQALKGPFQGRKQRSRCV